MSKSNITLVSVVIGLCVLLVLGLALAFGPSSSSTNDSMNELSHSDSPEDQITAPLKAEELTAYQVDMTNDKNPVAVFETNKGTFEIELFEDTMPITAGNFVKLAEGGFYNDVKFHRVIDGFMIQGGDPNSKSDNTVTYGTGGPGYAIADEHINGEYLTNVRGNISMANSGPNSGGSQFFINVADNQNLDFDKQPLSSKHPVFGRVLKGMNVVDEISLVETGQRDIPVEPVVINSVKIVRN